MEGFGKMITRSRAPLRLGFAGGGTDVSPYSDLYGGMVLNATINMFAYATIVQRDDKKIIINSIDRQCKMEYQCGEHLELNGNMDLIKAVYNSVVNKFKKRPLSFELTTYVDVPPGSGLGSSSTLVVAILGAFSEWLGLPLGEYELAHLAFEIERKDVGISGGKQDQYAASFGGFNFIEFFNNDRVIVNPLRIKREIINELQFSILLYYTGSSRLSSKIIEAQIRNVTTKKQKSIEAMHKLKEQSLMMKEAILKSRLDDIGEIFDFGWQYKKKMADEITNPLIDEIYEAAKKAGATGGKI